MIKKELTGEEIRNFMKSLGVNQNIYAARIGITKNYLSDLINNKKTASQILVRLILSINAERDFSLVPKYKARLSGGHGSFETSTEVENFLSFKTAWLKARCALNCCGLFEVRGDSMAPFITDGDVVLVNMSKNTIDDITDGKIYAFSEGDRVRVKRLSLKGAAIVAYSDNKLEGGDPTEVEPDFRLIGKVVWVGHEVG